jgi:hypothetical protein
VPLWIEPANLGVFIEIDCLACHGVLLTLRLNGDRKASFRPIDARARTKHEIA